MGTITFSEYSEGTSDPVYTFSDNVVSVVGEIVGDGSQPDTPVIAANSDYFGPVFAYFLHPVTTVSFDVGYFDNIGSTRIEFRDAQGHVIHTEHNTGYGVMTFSFSSTDGIASIAAIDETRDDSGFSVDTIVFGPPADALAPPTVAVASPILVPDRVFGTFQDRPYYFSDTLGGSDKQDVFKFTAEYDGTMVVTTYLDADPSNTVETTINITKGVNSIVVAPGETYSESLAYTVNLQVKYNKPEDVNKVDGFINNESVHLKHSGLEMIDFSAGLQEVLLESVHSKSEAVAFLKKFGATVRGAALGLDVANRIDNIIAADDWRRQAFVEIVDMTIGYGASVVGGGVISLVGTPLSAPLGATVVSLVYSTFVSHSVREAAAEMYDEPMDEKRRPAILSQASEVSGAVVYFDADYYLSQHSDARAAIEEGKVGSAMEHYLTVGVFKNYKPNAETAALSVSDIALDLANYQPGAGPASTVFSQEIGHLAGDSLSSVERQVADQVNALRTDGTQFNIDGELSGLANRIARDWTLNNRENVDIAFGPGHVFGTGATLSNNKDFRDALAAIPGLSLQLGSSVQILGISSVESDAVSVVDELLSTASSANALLGVGTKSIGIAEVGGIWIVLIDSNANQNDADDEAAQVSNAFVGTEFDDNISAGAAKAAIYGLDGSDNLIGGSFADKLLGGEGDDFMRGKGGNDVFDGGAGNDVAVYSGKYSEYTITRLSTGSIEVVSKDTDEGTDTLSNVEILRFADKDFSLSIKTAPVANDDAASMKEHTPVLVNVVENDSDADHDNFAVTRIVSVSKNGNATIENGQVRIGYTGADLEAGQQAQVTVVYQITDATGEMDTAKAIVTVNGIDDHGKDILGNGRSNKLVGTSLSELIDGKGGNDTITGKGGADDLIGGTGKDVIHGGNGNDSIVGDSHTWYLGSSTDNDVLYGENGDDGLYGNSGNDRLYGGAGKDWMDGGIGKDTLTGGSGADQFQTRTFSLSDQFDIFTDFKHSEGDKILVDSGPHGTIYKDKLFLDHAPAHYSKECLVYDQDSGKLYLYNSPIMGADVELLAVLQNHAKLEQSDFVFA